MLNDDPEDELLNEQNKNNDDLKELCFLLDEERYKMHQLAEQWKQFGTSSIQKLESQIFDYQEKLVDLEQRQVFLLKENESLKSLVNQMMTTNLNSPAKSQQNVSTQTYVEKQDDPLQQQISLQNMFDAIKVKPMKILFQEKSKEIDWCSFSSRRPKFMNRSII